MIEIGRLLPNWTLPTETTGAALRFAFKGFSFYPARTMPVRAIRINPIQPMKYQGCTANYFTAENGVGTSSWLTMLSMIWPSSSLLARPAIHSGSD
jgi:hypothetical protein